jgi:transposase-like protein
MGTWRRHSREFKLSVVERMKTSDNINDLARELNLERKLMYTWKYQFEGRPEKNHASYAVSAPQDTVEVRLRREVKELKVALGTKAAELDFFAAALRRVKEDRLSKGVTSEPVSTPKSRRSPSRKAN